MIQAEIQFGSSVHLRKCPLHQQFHRFLDAQRLGQHEQVRYKSIVKSFRKKIINRRDLNTNWRLRKYTGTRARTNTRTHRHIFLTGPHRFNKIDSPNNHSLHQDQRYEASFTVSGGKDFLALGCRRFAEIQLWIKITTAVQIR